MSTITARTDLPYVVLVLPETGACSVNIPLNDDTTAGDADAMGLLPVADLSAPMSGSCYG